MRKRSWPNATDIDLHGNPNEGMQDGEGVPIHGLLEPRRDQTTLGDAGVLIWPSARGLIWPGDPRSPTIWQNGPGLAWPSHAGTHVSAPVARPPTHHHLAAPPPPLAPSLSRTSIGAAKSLMDVRRDATGPHAPPNQGGAATPERLRRGSAFAPARALESPPPHARRQREI